MRIPLKTSLVLFFILLLPLKLAAHDNIEVHPYIAEQAFSLWPGSTDHELHRYMGFGYRDTSGLDFLTMASSCNNAKSGDKITEGTKEEDVYDPINMVCNIDLRNPGQPGKGYNHHFYDPDITGPANGLWDDAGAAEFAAQYLDIAKELYKDESSRTTAYWYLGRIAHLLADVSVPAHVHREIHVPFLTPDSYETFIASTYLLWSASDAAELDVYDPVPPDWTLADLFFNLGQRTQYFPGDRTTGNLVNANPYWSFGWPDTGGWIIPNGNDSYIEEGNLISMADRLMPLVIQYTSALYRLFWKEVHPWEHTTLPVPAGSEYFIYPPSVSPVAEEVPSKTRPIGVGYAARGADVLTLKVFIPEFSGPVDIYLALYFPAVDQDNMYLIGPDLGLQPLGEGAIKWKSTAGPVSEILYGDISMSGFPPGPYYFFALVTPPDALTPYYLWQTSLLIN